MVCRYLAPTFDPSKQNRLLAPRRHRQKMRFSCLCQSITFHVHHASRTQTPDIPMSTCCSLKMRSSSYHMPGIGFLYPSFAHAANSRNGTSGSFPARITVSGGGFDEKRNQTWHTAFATSGIFFFQSSSAAAWSAWLEINTTAYLNGSDRDGAIVNGTRVNLNVGSEERSCITRTRLDAAP